MAKDAARRADDAAGVPGRGRREVGRNGSSHARNKLDDKNVRKARGREADPRIAAAKAEQKAAERRLARLDAELADQSHIPYWMRRVQEMGAASTEPVAHTHWEGMGRCPKCEMQDAEEAFDAAYPVEPEPEPVADDSMAAFIARSTAASGVPLKVQDPEALAKVATLMAVPVRNIAARREAMELLEQGYHVDRVAARTGVPAADLRHLVGRDGYVTEESSSARWE